MLKTEHCRCSLFPPTDHQTEAHTPEKDRTEYQKIGIAAFKENASQEPSLNFIQTLEQSSSAEQVKGAKLIPEP